MLTIVMVAMLLTIRSVVRNWSQLTIAHHVVGVLLWVVVPLAATVLFWRGNALGRWILVGLYGLRGAGELVFLGRISGTLVAHPLMVFTEPLWTSLTNAVIFTICAAALAFGPVFRPRMDKHVCTGKA